MEISGKRFNYQENNTGIAHLLQIQPSQVIQNNWSSNEYAILLVVNLEVWGRLK